LASLAQPGEIFRRGAWKVEVADLQRVDAAARDLLGYIQQIEISLKLPMDRPCRDGETAHVTSPRGDFAHI
jgi:hypothetical protein